MIAPEHFTEHAVQGERLRRHRDGPTGGLHVRRRWPADRRGRSAAGWARSARTGEVALIVPTVDIRETGETHTIDGVEIEFQMAPGTEAPAEMHFYFPRYRALCMAENATHNLHNLLTLRGALVRDPHGWAGYLTEAIDTLHRPRRCGVRLPPLADLGQGPNRRIPVPATGSVRLPARPDAATTQPGLHGHRDRRELPDAARFGEGVAHARLLRLGQPQRQGGLPALHGLVRRQPGAGCGRIRRRRSATRYVDAIGGVDRVVELAQQAFDQGDFRWAATLLDHAMFTDQDHAAARTLYADTLEQLGLRRGERDLAQLLPLRCHGIARTGNFGTPAQTTSASIIGSSPRSRCSTRSRSTSTGRGPGTSTSPSTSPSSTSTPTTGSRCATACWSTARRPPTRRRPTPRSEAREQAAAVDFCGRRQRLAGPGGHRRRQRAAVDPGGAGPAGSELQHRHAVALRRARGCTWRRIM